MIEFRNQTLCAIKAARSSNNLPVLTGSTWCLAIHSTNPTLYIVLQIFALIASVFLVSKPSQLLRWTLYLPLDLPGSSRVRLASNTCTYRRFAAMDSWGRPIPTDDRRFYPSETDDFPSPSLQRQPSLRQQQLDPAQIPFVVSSPTSPQYHTTPPPPAFSNEPALWQLGRHSLYKPDAAHDKPSPTPNEKFLFATPAAETFRNWDFERVQHQVDRFDESKLIDVEGDLRRGLKARQVRSPLGPSRAALLTPRIDFNDGTRRRNWCWFSHWHRNGFKARCA